MSWLLLSDVVGSSVLSFSGVTASLGWVLSVVFMVAFCYLAYYSALLMSKTRATVEQISGSSPGSMGECARALLGNRAAQITYFVVYGLFAFLGNASYLLVLGDSLSDILEYWDISSCKLVTSFYAALMLLPLAATTRRLRNVSVMCFCNLFLILAVLGLCLGKLVSDGKREGAQTHVVDPNLTFLTFTQAMANILYAYAGHWMYFEIMAEMAQPLDFPKVFYINAPLQLSMYMTVAVVGYSILGSTGHHYLPDNLPKGSLVRLLVQLLLFAHISVAYLLKHVALARFLCESIRAGSADSSAKRDKLLFAGSTLCILAGGWVVCNAIPVFYDLLGLIGALLCGPISFVFPIGFFLLATLQRHSFTLGQPHNVTVSSFFRFVHNSVPMPKVCFLVMIVVSIAVIMVTGSYSSIKDINQQAEDGKISVFGC